MENSNNLNSNLKQEISYLALFENAKKSLQNEDTKNAFYYLNLVMNSEEIKNDLNTKFLCLIFLNQMKFKQKNFLFCLNISKKIIKYIRSKKYKLLSIDIQNLLISSLYSSSKLLDEKKFSLLSYLILYIGKNFIDELNLDSNDKNYQLIMKGFSSNIIQLQEQVKNYKENIFFKYEKIKELLILTSNIESKYRNISAFKIYYIISTQWYKKMVLFLKVFLEKTKEIDEIFYLNNIALLYVDLEEDDPDDREEFLGCYPGPINNFYLTKGKKIWKDPIDDYTNIYLKNDILEEKDFKILPIELYEKIKTIFGVYEEIERKSFIESKSNENFIEIHLQEMKILFINEYLRDLMKEEISLKNIQISKYQSLQDLKIKLIRTFINIFGELNKEETSFDIKIFKIEKKSKEIFNLIISHTNKNKFYKLKAEELKINEENNRNLINETKFFENPKNSVFIIEVIQKDLIIKPFIRIQSNFLVCNQCQAKIISKEVIVYCDSCNQSTYCSDYCKNLDQSHIDFHKKISFIFKKKFSFETLKKIKIENFFDSYSKAGIIGIKNLGNTCFISAAFHLLANCIDLSKYFLSKSHLEELKGKRLNSKGFISKIFFDLLREYWLSAQDCVNPIELKHIVSNLTNQVQGMNLTDAHDMVILLLRALHEDLNRNKDSQDSSLDFSEQNPNETDQDAANRWWTNFISRENSIITDLFYGQFKISIKCPMCKNIQSTYEPFLSISLPIDEKSDSRARFKIFSNDFKYEYFLVELIDIDKFTSVKHLKEKIKENPKNKEKEYDILLLKDKEVLKVLPDDELIYDYVFQRIDFTQEVFIDWEIIGIEVEQILENKNKGDKVTFYICPFNLIKENYLYYFTNEIKTFLTYPRAISISKKKKLKDLYIEVFRYFRRVIDDINDKKFSKFYENIKDDIFVEKEFEYYFSDLNEKEIKEENELKEIKSDNSINSEKDDEIKINFKDYKNPFLLFMKNNIPISQSYFTSTPYCEYCNEHCNYCKIENDINITIHEFYARQKIEREFIIFADFSLFNSNFRKFYFENTDDDDPIINCKGDISIYECFEHFQKESKIEKEKDRDMDRIKENDKENYFYCKICRKNLKGFKKIEIFRSPLYLIIQLKRFKTKVTSLMELVQNRKNETFVDFQNELNLTNFIKGSNNDISKYELVGVCNHSGKMNSGKFSSMQKGIKDGNWFEFIDEKIKEIDEEDLSNQNAYILVYRKKEKENNQKEDAKEIKS